MWVFVAARWEVLLLTVARVAVDLPDLSGIFYPVKAIVNEIIDACRDSCSSTSEANSVTILPCCIWCVFSCATLRSGLTSVLGIRNTTTLAYRQAWIYSP